MSHYLQLIQPDVESLVALIIPEILDDDRIDDFLEILKFSCANIIHHNFIASEELHNILNDYDGLIEKYNIIGNSTKALSLQHCLANLNPNTGDIELKSSFLRLLFNLHTSHGIDGDFTLLREAKFPILSQDRWSWSSLTDEPNWKKENNDNEVCSSSSSENENIIDCCSTTEFTTVEQPSVKTHFYSCNQDPELTLITKQEINDLLHQINKDLLVYKQPDLYLRSIINSIHDGKMCNDKVLDPIIQSIWTLNEKIKTIRLSDTSPLTQLFAWMANRRFISEIIVKLIALPVSGTYTSSLQVRLAINDCSKILNDLHNLCSHAKRRDHFKFLSVLYQKCLMMDFTQKNKITTLFHVLLFECTKEFLVSFKYKEQEKSHWKLLKLPHALSNLVNAIENLMSVQHDATAFLNGHFNELKSIKSDQITHLSSSNQFSSNFIIYIYFINPINKQFSLISECETFKLKAKIGKIYERFADFYLHQNGHMWHSFARILIESESLDHVSNLGMRRAFQNAFETYLIHNNVKIVWSDSNRTFLNFESNYLHNDIYFYQQDIEPISKSRMKRFSKIAVKLLRLCIAVKRLELHMLQLKIERKKRIRQNPVSNKPYLMPFILHHHLCKLLISIQYAFYSLIGKFKNSIELLTTSNLINYDQIVSLEDQLISNCEECIEKPSYQLTSGTNLTVNEMLTDVALLCNHGSIYKKSTVDYI